MGAGNDADLHQVTIDQVNRPTQLRLDGTPCRRVRKHALEQ